MPEIIERNFIENILEKNYSAKICFKKFFIFKINNRIYLASQDLLKIKPKMLKIKPVWFGFYFGQLKNGKIILSLEGAQMVGPKAKKNVAILDEKNLRNFLLGFNIFSFKEVNCELGNFVILKYKQDVVGVGKKMENYIENLMVKTRRFS